MESIDNFWKPNSLLIPQLSHAEIQCNKSQVGLGASNIQRCSWKLPLEENNYEGNYFQDCQHGNGLYKWVNLKDEEVVYEGQFYANDRHGYGSLSYANGELYEGLFKNNKRFEPGIFTYNNGLQDVGFWDNLQIRRLCGTLRDDKIPKLGVTQVGKAKLLRYRYLVPILQEDDDIATQILKELASKTSVECEVLKQSHLLYSDTCRDPNSLFFDKHTFDKKIQGNDDTIAVCVLGDQRERKSLEFIPFDKEAMFSRKSDCNIGVRKIMISHLIAWNNGSLPIELLKHTFKNRTSESYLSQKIDRLLACDRNSFRSPGTHEENCIRFLYYCFNGQRGPLRYLVDICNVHPDVTDAKGNTGLFFAANEDNCSAIKLLAKLGVDMNHLNDEGLTPLTLCLLRYLAVQNNISNWETGFLPPEKSFKNIDPATMEWGKPQSLDNIFDVRPTTVLSSSSLTIDGSIDSFDALNTKSILFSQFPTDDSLLKLNDKLNNGDKNDSKKNKYLFNTDVKDLLKKDKIDKSSPKKKSRMKAVDRTNSKLYALLSEKNELERIKQTISLLLFKGADPNAGEVPFPPIILATFTKNIEIIEMLLRAGANPNTKVRDDEGGVTPLHLILSMEPSPFLSTAAETFLKYKADPNIRASPSFWSVLDKTIVNDSYVSTSNALGKTPLHMLCMRPDIEEENGLQLLKLAHVLLKNKANPNLQLLGHTPLSIAMVKGYKELVRELLSSERVDPNQTLPDDLGVPLTLLLHDEYIDAVPLDLVVSLMNVLVEFGANPLVNVTENTNAYEFVLKRIEKSKQKATPPSLKTALDKKKEIIKKRKENKLISHLRELVKRSLVKQFEGNIVRKIYNESEPKEVKKLPQHTRQNIHFEKAVNIFRKMGDARERLHPEKVEKTLDFVIEHEHEDTKAQKTKTNVDSTEHIENEHSEEQMVEKNRLEKLAGYLCEPLVPKSKSVVRVVHPEADTEHKRYRACFQCLSKKGFLIRCPVCHLVWFCSAACNKKNSETSNNHQCPQFYAEEYARLHSPSRTSSKKSRSKSSKSSKSNRSRQSEKSRLSSRSSSLSHKSSPRKNLQVNAQPNYDHINKEITQRYIEFLLQMAGSGHQLDLDCLYFPYCAYFDGNLYYRLFNGTLMCQGNYSII